MNVLAVLNVFLCINAILFQCFNIYTVSKNVQPLTCYNLDIDDTSMIIFGISITEEVRNQTTSL